MTAVLVANIVVLVMTLTTLVILYRLLGALQKLNACSAAEADRLVSIYRKLVASIGEHDK